MTDDKKPDGDQTPAPYKPGEATKPQSGLPDHYRLTMKHIKFLDEYSKHLDVAKAAKAAEVKLRTVKETWLKEDKFAVEIAKIEEIWATNIQMTAEHASARHIKLMDKMEGHLDDCTKEVIDKKTGEKRIIKDTDTAAKVMNPLAKMSDTYLKAAGKFKDEGQNKGLTVNINVTKAKDEVIEVEGETE